MRKWISLVSVAALGDSVADDLLRLPLLRAMFAELIGKEVGMIQESNELFLMGLLSVMDALLNVPMPDVLAESPVDAEIKKALLGRESHLSADLRSCPGLRIGHVGTISALFAAHWPTREFSARPLLPVGAVGW